MEGININVSAKGTYPGASKTKTLKFNIHLIDGDPASVTINGKKLSRGAWKYEHSSSTLSFTTKWTVANDLSIEIR